MHKRGCAAGQWSRSLSRSFAGPPVEIWIGSVQEGEGDWVNVVKVGLIGGWESCIRVNTWQAKLAGVGRGRGHTILRKILKQSCSDGGSKNLCAQISTSTRRVITHGLCWNLRKTWGPISPRNFHLAWVKVDSVWVFFGGSAWELGIATDFPDTNAILIRKAGNQFDCLRTISSVGDNSVTVPILLGALGQSERTNTVNYTRNPLTRCIIKDIHVYLQNWINDCRDLQIKSAYGEIIGTSVCYFSILLIKNAAEKEQESNDTCKPNYLNEGKWGNIEASVWNNLCSQVKIGALECTMNTVPLFIILCCSKQVLVPVPPLWLLWIDNT